MTPAAAAWSETCPSGLVSDCIHTTCSAGAELHCVDGLCTCNSPPRSKHHTASLHTILYTCIIQIYQGWCKNVKNINLILLNYWLVCQYVDILSIYMYNVYVWKARLYRTHDYRSLLPRYRWKILPVSATLLFLRYKNGNKRVCKYLIINLLRCLFKKKSAQKPRYSPVFKLYIWSVSLVWLQSASREMTV